MKWLKKTYALFFLFLGKRNIVDTPGIGDEKQNRIAEKMMEYLPNALAFVFVLNVPSGGGIQCDRVRVITF